MKNKTKDSIMAVCFCASLIGFGGSGVAFSLNDWILGIILLVSFIIFFTISAIIIEIGDCEKESKEKIDDIKPEDLSKYIKIEDLPKVLKTLDMETNVFEQIFKTLDLKPYARIEDLRLRDELIKSKFIGKLKNKKLIEEFKNDFRFLRVRAGAFNSYDTNIFCCFCNKIELYDFEFLDLFIEKLRCYEAKQKILDEYKEEELCKKNAKTSKNSKN